MGIKAPVDKLIFDKFKKLVTHGMTSGSTNFTMLFQIKDGPACIVFSLFPKRSIVAAV